MNDKRKEIKTIEDLLASPEWRKLAEEADSRERYKNHITKHIAGAVREFYKARCAEKNNLPGVKGWRKEVSQHLGALYDAIMHPISGFDDRRTAIDEVIAIFKVRDAKLRARAESEILTDFPALKGNLQVRLDESDSELFWNVAIEGTIRQAFEDFGLH